MPQARLVSLQPDQESRSIKQLAAKEAPLTFGSFHVQELLGGDNNKLINVEMTGTRVRSVT